MTVKDNGGPAFPVPADTWSLTGMSLRDYFAAKAMQGMLSNPAFQEICKDFSGEQAIEYIKKCSFGFSDAMLEEREK